MFGYSIGGSENFKGKYNTREEALQAAKKLIGKEDILISTCEYTEVVIASLVNGYFIAEQIEEEAIDNYGGVAIDWLDIKNSEVVTDIENCIVEMLEKKYKPNFFKADKIKEHN